MSLSASPKSAAPSRFSALEQFSAGTYPSEAPLRAARASECHLQVKHSPHRLPHPGTKPAPPSLLFRGKGTDSEAPPDLPSGVASEKSLDLSELLFQALQDEAMDTGSRAWSLIGITAGPLEAHQGPGLVHLKMFG